MACLGRMHEQSRCTRGGQGCRDFARHMAGFAHAGNNHASRDGNKMVDRGGKFFTKPGSQRGQCRSFRCQDISRDGQIVFEIIR